MHMNRRMVPDLKTSSRHDSPNRDWYGLNDRDYEHKKWKVFFMK
jgi:hypothetical protein